jgi:hypothetical protein
VERRLDWRVGRQPGGDITEKKNTAPTLRRGVPMLTVMAEVVTIAKLASVGDER